MSILPRHLRPGGQVTIHVGLQNRSARPIRPFVRVTVFDPEGRDTRLFAQHVAVFMNYREDDDLLARRRRMTNIYRVFEVPPGAPLGCYRVRVENFAEGDLRYSENVETDFFFVEDLTVEAIEPAAGGRLVSRIRNRSPEPVKARLHEPDPEEPGRFLEREVEFPAGSLQALETGGGMAFLAYAGCEMITLSPDQEGLCLRNQRFFARREDDETLFVLDPRAERKRNFFLTGRAKTLWEAASGFRPRSALRTEENEDVYDAMVKAELLVELGEEPGRRST